MAGGSTARAGARIKANGAAFVRMSAAQRAVWIPRPPPPEPSTTAELARSGTVVGTTEDVLRVAAWVRCLHKRTLLAAVLYLDQHAVEQRGEESEPRPR